MNSTSYVSVRHSSYNIAHCRSGRGTVFWLLTICNSSQEELALLFFLLLAAVVATFFIQHYKLTWLPPSAAAMCLGILGGGVAWLMGELPCHLSSADACTLVRQNCIVMEGLYLLLH